MLELSACFGALGRPAPRRLGGLLGEAELEQEAWTIAAGDRRVAALRQGDRLWVAAATRLELVDGRVTPLVGVDEPPPGPIAELGVEGSGWSCVPLRAGVRYLFGAGIPSSADGASWARLSDAELLAAALASGDGVEGSSQPQPRPGLWARLRARVGSAATSRAEPSGVAALVLRVDARPEPADLREWVARLREREVDLSWFGNEAGPGFIHTIARPLAPGRSVRDALLDHARAHADLAGRIREHAEVWLEQAGEPVDDGERLVPDEPARGWVEALELDAIATDLRGTGGRWLDPGTAAAQRAWSYQLPGPAILAALHRYLDAPTIVAVHSAPEEAVLAIHLIGGRDRVSGDLHGFALERIWT
jgi:hypothetical protein